MVIQLILLLLPLYVFVGVTLAYQKKHIEIERERCELIKQQNKIAVDFFTAAKKSIGMN